MLAPKVWRSSGARGNWPSGVGGVSKNIAFLQQALLVLFGLLLALLGLILAILGLVRYYVTLGCRWCVVQVDYRGATRKDAL